MEAKYTPGPWIWMYADDHTREPVHEKPLRLIADESCDCVLQSVSCLDNIDGSGQLCCYIEVSLPDMKIIAAAPELVEVLQAIMFDLAESHATEKDTDHYGDGPENCLYCRHLAEAKTALDKAGR